MYDLAKVTRISYTKVQTFIKSATFIINKCALIKSRLDHIWKPCLMSEQDLQVQTGITSELKDFETFAWNDQAVKNSNRKQSEFRKNEIMKIVTWKREPEKNVLQIS